MSIQNARYTDEQLVVALSKATNILATSDNVSLKRALWRFVSALCYTQEHLLGGVATDHIYLEYLAMGLRKRIPGVILLPSLARCPTGKPSLKLGYPAFMAGKIAPGPAR